MIPCLSFSPLFVQLLAYTWNALRSHCVRLNYPTYSQLILDIDNSLLEATGAAPPPGVPSIRAILLNQVRASLCVCHEHYEWVHA